MKAMLASDWDEAKVKFPCFWQPKVDGVRALHFIGKLTGRSLKPHANQHTTRHYANPVLAGLDGELAAERDTHPDLCRITTSAVNTIEGAPYTQWHLFDYIGPRGEYSQLGYAERFLKLVDHWRWLLEVEPALATHLRPVVTRQVNTMVELLALDEWALDQGYEGSIIRSLAGPYKYGRSTVREGYLLRIKRFVEEEAVVEAIEEGQTNLNEAKTNALGLTERSTHQENMVPNGMVGNLRCRLLKPLVVNGREIIPANGPITVAAGRMPHEDRVRYFQQQDQIIGKVIKFQFFPKGLKDKPRFPTFQTIRAESDL